MTTDKDKLQKLFQAALNDSAVDKPKLTRAYPTPCPLEQPVAQPITLPTLQAVMQVAPETTPVVSTSDLVQPLPNAGLDEAASEELRILLEDQHLRLRRKRRRDSLMFAALLFGTTGGGFGWFVQSPDRVNAVTSAIKEVRSAGDVMAIVGSYKKALAKIATRSSQIDTATESMGVSSSQVGMKDVDMDAEMSAMMGGEGKTVGQRNKLLREKFGSWEKNPPKSPGDLGQIAKEGESKSKQTH
jgi:ribosomal protein L25 (general stress protein Ctc)